MATESPSCLVATMAPCQQLRSGLSSPDSRYQQQNPAVIYQRSKSLSPSQLGYQQPGLMATPAAIGDGHRSVLVHAGSPAQSSAVLQHSPGHQQSSPVIHYSPTNQQLRCGSHQEFQHIMCCENFPSGVSRSSQAQRLSPSSYPTVIQQQAAPGARAAKNGSPGSQQKEVLPAGVTIKQEQNLDQAYLDDGKCCAPLRAALLEGGSELRVPKAPVACCGPLGGVDVAVLSGWTGASHQVYFWLMAKHFGHSPTGPLCLLCATLSWSHFVSFCQKFHRQFGKWRI